MPIRWQCPLAVKTRVYTSKSDVYSFGVLLFEMVSGGATPFAELKTDEVMAAVEAGHRLRPPLDTSEKMRQIIHSCTTINVAQRPSMQTVRQHLAAAAHGAELRADNGRIILGLENDEEGETGL